jgi:Calcineurin-like phosphoesterase
MPNSKSYTYRDPILSLWQSAVRQVRPQEIASKAAATPKATDGSATAPLTEDDFMAPAHTIGIPLTAGQEPPAAITAPPPAAAAKAVGAGGLAIDCAETAAKFLWAEIKGDQTSSAIYAAELHDSPCNVLGWSECVTTYLSFKVSLGSLPYRKNQNVVVTIPDQARIAIIGDWGTGESTAKNLLQQVASFKPDILLHLGDIYFAGTQHEANTNFLTICRKVLGNIPLYSMCGNHDMYSGGNGYYWLLDQIGQKSSYFCLQNDYWQLLAMDTGYNDRNPFTVTSNMTSLYNQDGWNEADWHLGKIQQAGNRRIALFSHHQLFSPFGSVGTNSSGQPSAYNPNLLANFQNVLPKVAIWFWGHEHTLALYDEYLGLERGRCVGASAVPVFTNQQDYADDDSLLNGNVTTLPTWNPAANLGSTDGDYNNAFAIMTLNGAAAAVVNYYQVPPNGPYTQVPFTDTI